VSNFLPFDKNLSKKIFTFSVYLVTLIEREMFLAILLVFPAVFGQSPTPLPPPSCDGVEEFTYIASLNDCRLYYQCIGGIAFQLQCPRGNYFGGFLRENKNLKFKNDFLDTGRQTCVSYGESDCPLLTPPPPPAPPTCDDVPEFGYIPSNATCAQYYQCFGGEQWLMQCPRGNYFSFERQTCVPYGESDCWMLNTTVAPPSEDSCEGENCFENIETAPIVRERMPRGGKEIN
jgi:hypothetical protein